MSRLNSITGKLSNCRYYSCINNSPNTLNGSRAKAAGTSVGKTVECDTSKHTKNYCDGFTIGKTDCRDGRAYDGNSAFHTTDWKGGYRAGWTGAGCHVPRK